LHGASEGAAAEALHGQAHVEAEERARRAAEADAQSRAYEQAYAPWVSEPHMKVHLSGDPVVDAQLLGRLNDELATPLDPDRIRAGSLADDALADDTLAGLSPRRPDGKQRSLWRFLREDSHLDVYHLSEALRSLKGEVLLVMGHIDATDNALVFKGADGKPRRLPRDLFDAAARNAAVHLFTVGCKSARKSSAGFVDDLNSLDAARAIAQAMHSRPSTMFELYGALSGPERVIQFDPASFEAMHSAEVTSGPDGAVVSTIQWSGPLAVAAVAVVAAVAESSPETPERAALSETDRAGVWRGPAARVLLGLVLTSWAIGAFLTWTAGQRGLAWGARVAVDGIAHGLMVPALLTMLAEAVDGRGASWWAWGMSLILLLICLAALLAVTLGRHPKASFDAVNAPKQPYKVVWIGCLLARGGLLASPFLAVALLHAGWATLPVPVMNCLLVLYSMGRPLPSPWWFLLGSLLLVLLYAYVDDVCKQFLRRRDEHRAGMARAILWRQQLAADGVTGLAAAGAVSSRLAFEDRCGRPPARQARWEETKALTDSFAPDPWAGLARRSWRLVAVPLIPREGNAEPRVGFGLLRPGSPFFHPLPPVLLQRWRAQQVQPTELVVLLAQLEPRLRWVDFLAPGELPPVKSQIRFGLFWVGVTGGLAWLCAEGTMGRWLSLAVGGITLLLAVLWPCLRLLRLRWRFHWLQHVQPRPLAGIDPHAAATA
jgi:hypothetical protein